MQPAQALLQRELLAFPRSPVLNESRYSKEFSKALGYRVALVARRLKDLQTVADQINVKGGQV